MRWRPFAFHKCGPCTFCAIKSRIWLSHCSPTTWSLADPVILASTLPLPWDESAKVHRSVPAEGVCSSTADCDGAASFIVPAKCQGTWRACTNKCKIISRQLPFLCWSISQFSNQKPECALVFAAFIIGLSQSTPQNTILNFDFSLYNKLGKLPPPLFFLSLRRLALGFCLEELIIPCMSEILFVFLFVFDDCIFIWTASFC